MDGTFCLYLNYRDVMPEGSAAGRPKINWKKNFIFSSFLYCFYVLGVIFSYLICRKSFIVVLTCSFVWKRLISSTFTHPELYISLSLLSCTLPWLMTTLLRQNFTDHYSYKP